MTQSAQDESTLCVSCGLCCQGPLYTWAKLDPGELELADRLALRVIPSDTDPGFALPCSCLDGTRCTVYAERPQICRDFACSLLLNVRSGKITLEQAQDRVREAHGLLDEIESELPQDALKRVWERVNERWDLNNLRQLMAEGAIEPDIVMAMVALDVLFENHFRLHDAGGG